MVNAAKYSFVASMTLLGLAGIIVGGMFPWIVQQQILDGVPASIRSMSDSGEYAVYGSCGSSDTYGGSVPSTVDGKCSDGSTGTTHYYFYNITNALAMVESGAVPELTEIHVAVDWVSIDFNVVYSTDDNGDEIVSYQTWSYYSPSEEYKDVLESKITQINPVYFAGIAGLAGTEKTVFMGFSYLVMGEMANLYNSTMRSVSAGLCGGYTVYSLTGNSAYAAYGECSGYCAYCAPSDWPSDVAAFGIPNACTGDYDSAFALFGDYSTIESLIGDNSYDNNIATTRGLGSDSILHSQYIYDAISSVDQEGADSIVVEPELSTYSRDGNNACDEATTGTFSYYYWTGFYDVYMASLGVTTTTDMQPDAYSYSPTKSCDLQFTTDQIVAFFNAFSDETFSQQFLATIYAWYSMMYDDTSQCVALVGTDCLSAKNTIQYIDVAGYGFSLVGLFSDSRCVDAGINYGNAWMVFRYLSDYSVEQFMLRGFIVGYNRDRDTGTLSLNADGTGNKNSGLITTHTIEDFIFGYNDTLAKYVTTMSYNGIIGKQYESIEGMVKNKPAMPVSKYTGKDDTDLFNTWYSNANGSTAIQTRKDLGYVWSNINSKWEPSTCDSEPWLETNYGSDDCYIWQKCEDGTDDCTDEFEVELKKAANGLAFKPFFEMSENEELYAETFKRKLTFTARSADLPEFGLGEMVDMMVRPELYAGYDIHGIKTIRYDMDASNFENSTANDVYYMGPKHEDVQVWADNWMMPMDRINYYPAAYSKPWLCDADPNVQSKVKVTRSKDTEGMECSDVEPYIAVEPMTGMTLEKQLMFQVNWQMSTTMLDGTLFTNVASSTRSLPLFWTGQKDSIAANDALTLKTELFDNVDLGIDLLIGLVVAGVVILLAATVFASQWEKMFPPKKSGTDNTDKAPGIGMV